MDDKFQIIEDRFNKNIEDVYQLIQLDSHVINTTLIILRNLDENIKKSNIDNVTMLPGKAIQNLENIKNNDSLKPHYETMYNQSIVLLVSLFASAVSDLFKEGVNQLAKLSGTKTSIDKEIKSLMKQEIKLTVDEIIGYGDKLPEHIGDIIAEKQDISFQDMKSINRAFRTFFSFNMVQDSHVNNIIIAQAARHVIVHDAAKVNKRTRNQVSRAIPRSVKDNLLGVTFIKFEPNEIKEVGNSMLVYFQKLRRNIAESLKND
jgi:hypothetical protein